MAEFDQRALEQAAPGAEDRQRQDEADARIAELRRIASWWASKEVPAEDDEAGSQLDTALERLTTVRQTAQAVETALRRRLRPIFMSTLTSIFGMLPLMLMPGEGSAIYRGMAAAVVGGMSVSTVFTLILLPSLLRLNFKQEFLQVAGHMPSAGGLLARRKRHREPAE